MSFYRETPISQDKYLRAYLIGLAIGDGNLSNPDKNKRATRLRITCDTKYPKLLKRIARSLKRLLPENDVSFVNRPRNCIDVSVYSNHLENLLGWKVGAGPKYIQNVSVPSWIMENPSYAAKCLKGLIETDGSIYYDRGYKMVIFSTLIEKLAADVQKIFSMLGFKAHFYKVPNKINRFGMVHKYQVRLSKNVEQFLAFVKPEKV